MTREEQKAKESKKYYGDDFNCYYAFLHGAEWADKHPVNMWHDASEEPKEEEFILLEVINTRSEEDEVKYFIEYSRKWVVDSMKTEGFKCRWVYVKDLLPKGGEK